MLAGILGSRGISLPGVTEADQKEEETGGAALPEAAGGQPAEEAQENAGTPAAEPSAQANAGSQPPPAHRLARSRRDFLVALRPYLGTRRCASCDRMIRALELYEIIGETHLMKGGKT